MTFALAGLVIFIGGLPGYQLLLLIRCREAISKDKPTRLSKAMSSLHEPFKAYAFWW